MNQQQPVIDNHITVCICTFNRPQMLSNLLNTLQNLTTEKQFTYSAVIVDNDAKQSGRSTVIDWKQKSRIKIDYICEPEQNIALARNKAIENVIGNYIAFIDDDEFPNGNWLINLFTTIQKYKCAGVLGPVIPYFESNPPLWIIKSRVCERPSFVTGTILRNPNHTRTGNVLLNKKMIGAQGKPFNPAYGRTGGEDVDFFKRMMQKGFNYVWCNEAQVYEIVPPERFNRSYYINRALMRGLVNSKATPVISISTVKSLTAFLLYTSTMPIFLLLGHHLFMKYLIKDCDHIGKLLGLCGIKIIQERSW